MPCKTGELTTASDGLPARCVGQWSKDKCYYIGRYAAIFSAGMKDKFPKRDYIDLFAGPWSVCTFRRFRRVRWLTDPRFEYESTIYHLSNAHRWPPSRPHLPVSRRNGCPTEFE